VSSGDELTDPSLREEQNAAVAAGLRVVSLVMAGLERWTTDSRVNRVEFTKDGLRETMRRVIAGIKADES
jgi:hypothetical protein